MNIKNTESKIFSSFDRSFSVPVFFKKPEKYKEIENLSNIESHMINTGSNLSYCPLSFQKDSLSIILKRFNRIINFDKKNKEITVEAGMTLADFLNFTLKQNLWIPQLPGYPLITLAGAVATNAHGKSCAVHGTIKNSIKNILIFHKTNGWLNLSEEENKEVFDLTVGGLGLTGSIINITFKLSEITSKKFVTKKKYVANLTECVNTLKKQSTKNDTYIYSWNMANNFEEFGKGIIFENIPNHNQANDYLGEKIPSKNIPIWPKINLWNKVTLKLANRIFYLINRKNKLENFNSVIFPFYGKENYFKFFGKKGFLESQLLIHEDNCGEFLEEFKSLFKKYDPTISLISFKNMSGSQKYLRFEGNKICITIDYVNNKKSLLFMSEMDKLCIKFKLLPSIIKDSRLEKNIVENCYEEFSVFKKNLRIFDKNRFYQSEVSKKLGL